MNRIVVNSNLDKALRDVGEPVELCDEAGRVLGHYFPAVDLSQYGPLEPQISEEELDRRERENQKRYTTAEVLRYLESL
jgi:hypothetical protein